MGRLAALGLGALATLPLVLVGLAAWEAAERALAAPRAPELLFSPVALVVFGVAAFAAAAVGALLREPILVLVGAVLGGLAALPLGLGLTVFAAPLPPLLLILAARALGPLRGATRAVAVAVGLLAAAFGLLVLGGSIVSVQSRELPIAGLAVGAVVGAGYLAAAALAVWPSRLGPGARGKAS